MDKTTSKISAFFEKNFRKKFILFVSVPVLMSILFCVDYFVLQELNVIDTVSRIGKMTHTVGGEHLEMEGARLGYRYNTENNHTFSTIKKHRVPSEIKLKISPIFRTVKAVEIENQKLLNLTSGFNGIKGGLLIFCNSAILISVCYIGLAKKITSNARLNLISLHFFIFSVWIIALCIGF